MRSDVTEFSIPAVKASISRSICQTISSFVKILAGFIMLYWRTLHRIDNGDISHEYLKVNIA